MSAGANRIDVHESGAVAGSASVPAFARTPFGMVGAAVLFWGWQTGMLLVAVPLALVIETGVLWRPRWVLDTDGINRFADLSSLALIGVGAWFLVTLEAPRAARTVIGMAQWLPLTLSPLVLAQACLARVPLDLSVLFVTIRARPETGLKVHFGFVYTIACVLAAATANVRDEMFYGGAAVFAAWSLWNLRSRRYNRLIPFGMLMLASVMGYAGHIGLNQFQGALTEWVSEQIMRSVNTNPFRTHTDIGQIGELKQSERILLRVRLPEGEKTPVLLHRASYNVFSSPAWIARPLRFDPVAGESATGWSLRPDAQPPPEGAARREQAVEVLEYARNGRTIAALPMDTVHVDGLPPSELRRSPMGSVNIDTAAGFLRYRATRGEGAQVEIEPGEFDMRVPPREADAIHAIGLELGLQGLDPVEARRRVEQFFAENFHYSTWLEASSPFAPTPLSAFLLKTRAGHCEYFASATTLLLREAGIPARYATGFSVQEQTGSGDYVVRERHAHAWVRAWMDGKWVDIDTTPPQWFSVEGGKGGLWESLSDAWSWLKFTWGRYQTNEEDAVPRPVLIGLLVLLFGWLAWRIFRQPSRRAQVDAKAIDWPGIVKGADSEFYEIEAMLAGRSLGRRASESLSEWLARVARSEVFGKGADELRSIVALHCRLRFDPQPMEAAAREELRLSVRRWLESFRRGDVGQAVGHQPTP